MTAAAIFLAIAMLTVEAANGTIQNTYFAWVGAILGTFGGLVGAAFGVVSSAKAHKLRRIIADEQRRAVDGDNQPDRGEHL